MIMKNLKRYTLFLIIIISASNYSCKKFLEIPPPKDAATPVQLFENDEIATSAVTGIYSRMTAFRGFSGDQGSISVLAGLSADEFKSYNFLPLNEFYQNEISTNNSSLSVLWSDIYAYIYTTNAVLEGLSRSNGVTENTRKQLQGEAKFIRAFCYFYLVNLFGEVPLNLGTDYRINEIASKASKEKIYSQIIADLEDAQSLLSTKYISNERIRPNKWAAKALLSRVYLYSENWDLALKNATEIIDEKTTFVLVDDLNKVFLKNSSEAIWQLMPTAGNNTPAGALFILTNTPTFVSLLSDFGSSFENGDNRRTMWIGEYSNNTGKYLYPLKYKIRATTSTTGINEYSMVIRLAEIYLIRAEARAKLERPELALEDINLVRKRAGMIVPLAGLNSLQCLAETEKQRKFELFSEWGHRWLDLIRTNRANAVLAPLKGITWQSTDISYPIPDNETNRNPSIRGN